MIYFFSGNFTQIRNISVTPCVSLIQKWRGERGLPLNPNANGVLTDKADFSYVDGRPTPYGVGQKRRLLKQKDLLNKILTLSKEVDYAVERHQTKLAQEKLEKQRIIDSKLKPKGILLNKS